MGLKLREAFHKFSDTLKPDPDFQERGTAACNHIFEILREIRADVAEVKIAGSIGKRTAVSYPGVKEPDFDVVIFLNIANPPHFSQKAGPPFKNILEDFKRIFSLYPDEITLLNTNATDFIGIQIEEFKLDVAPAICFKNTPRPPPPPGVSQKEHQKEKTLELIASLSSPWKFSHYYNAGLAESAVDYVKSEAARLNAHQILRLAKFWARSLKIPPHVKYTVGQSYLMERVALHAAEETGPNSDLISRVEKFLELMSDFSVLEIFEPWSEQALTDMWMDDPDRQPIVLDPVNPHNNIALLHHSPEGRRDIIKCFEEGASHCLEKLEHFKRREARGQHLESEDDIKEILDQSKFISNPCDLPLRVEGDSTSPRASASSSRLQVQRSVQGPSQLVQQTRQQQKQEKEEEGFGWGATAAIVGGAALAGGLIWEFTRERNQNQNRGRRN